MVTYGNKLHQPKHMTHVIYLFLQRERGKFLKFVNGSTRMPKSQKFKLKPSTYGKNEAYLPQTHTCFFGLDLPEYSTLETMQERLRYAFNNCEEIDGDDDSTARSAAALLFEEDGDYE